MKDTLTIIGIIFTVASIMAGAFFAYAKMHDEKHNQEFISDQAFKEWSTEKLDNHQHSEK